MKKMLIAITLCLMVSLITSTALAEPITIELETMTREELHALIDQARTELLKYELYADTDVVLFDDQDVKVTMQSHEMDDTELKLKLIVENNSENAIIVSGDDMYINGWSMYLSLGVKVAAGKKSKEEVFIYDMDEIDVETIDQLEQIEFYISLVDPESYNTLFMSDAININFN